jgi:hypothetical protein
VAYPYGPPIPLDEFMQANRMHTVYVRGNLGPATEGRKTFSPFRQMSANVCSAEHTGTITQLRHCESEEYGYECKWCAKCVWWQRGIPSRGGIDLEINYEAREIKDEWIQAFVVPEENVWQGVEYAVFAIILIDGRKQVVCLLDFAYKHQTERFIIIDTTGPRTLEHSTQPFSTPIKLRLSEADRQKIKECYI